MLDEIFECIKSRRVIPLCYVVCKNYYENTQKLMHAFIELYAKNYSHTTNIQLLKGIRTRLDKVLKCKHDKEGGSKMMIELFLLLYNCPINSIANYTNKNTSYEYHDLSILLNDNVNRKICKDICYKCIKPKQTQDKISFNVVDDKNKNDYIWLLWYELMKIAKHLDNSDLLIWIKIQLNIFSFCYGKTILKSRIYILYSIIDMMMNELHTKVKFTLTKDNIIKMSFLEIMFKIDYIQQELGFVTNVRKRVFLGNIAMLLFAEKTTHDSKIYQYRATYIPEKKQIATVPSKNKICFDKIIKQT